MKERNLSIDAIKGIAITLVMLGHVFVHNHMEDPYLYDAIRAVQMPLFMIISGYLCGQGRKISDLKTYGKVLGKRAISYLVPFFVWLTAMHLRNLAEAYRIIFVQLDYGLWFLAVLFILTFFVYTAQLAAGKMRGKNALLSELVFWAVYGMFCVMLTGQIAIGNRFLSPGLTILYVPFYMLGYITGNYGKYFICRGTKEPGKLDCKNSLIVKSAVLIMSVVFIYLAAAKNLNSMETRPEMLLQMVASLLGSIAIIYGVLCWKDGKIKNMFAKLGGYTLEIYVIHYHFANMLNFNDKQYDFYTIEGFLFVAASFAAMSAVTFVCVWLMKKVKLLDFLFFGKRSGVVAAGRKETVFHSIPVNEDSHEKHNNVIRRP